MTRRTFVLIICFVACALSLASQSWAGSDPHLTDRDFLETHGLSVLLFHNSYHHVFGDQKMSGMEIILQDRRIATNGDVRLSATPAQWDPIPDFQGHKRGSSPNELIACCAYPDRGLSYHIDVKTEARGFCVAIGHFSGMKTNT
jgi:hypothetical protein